MSGQELFDFARLRKPSGGFLRIHQGAVDDDFENAVLALDQLGFDSEPSFNVVRQTGGSGSVVSDNAVFDRQHGSSGDGS